MKLYELNVEYQEIHDELIETGGDLTKELEARLDALDTNLEVKVDNIGRLIKDLEGSAVAPADEAKRLSRLASVRVNSAKRLKLYLLEALQNRGVLKIKTDLFQTRIQVNSQASVTYVAKEGESPGSFPSVPAEFLKMEYSLNRDAVMEAWNAREALVAAGAEVDPWDERIVVERGVHLRL